MFSELPKHFWDLWVDIKENVWRGVYGSSVFLQHLNKKSSSPMGQSALHE